MKILHSIDDEKQYYILENIDNNNSNDVIIGEFKLDSPVSDLKYWWFYEFLIYDKYRNQGNGTKAMKLILQLKQLKRKYILLTVDRENKHAIYIYKKLGFELISSEHRTDDTYKLVNNSDNNG